MAKQRWGLVRMPGESWQNAMLRTARQMAPLKPGTMDKLVKLFEDGAEEGNSEESAALDALIELECAPTYEQAQRTEPEEIVVVTVREDGQAPVEVHPFESLAPWRDIVKRSSDFLRANGLPVDAIGLERTIEQAVQTLDISRMALMLNDVDSERARQAIQDGTIPFPFWREPDKVWPEYGRPVLIQLKRGVHGVADGRIDIGAFRTGFPSIPVQPSRTFVAYLSCVEDGLGQKWPHSWRTVCLAFDEGGKAVSTRAADFRIKLLDVLRWSELPPEPKE